VDRNEMDRLIEQHLVAEAAGDVPGAVAMYTDDVVHDVVGLPTGPGVGKEAAMGFYGYLTSNVNGTVMTPTRTWYGEDFCVAEHQATAKVVGEFLGVPGRGKEISFRILHVWEFSGGKMSRENVWMDGGSAIAQLTAS
jgi:steroid delta-isomerase-like uncharacterized protein